MTQRRFEKSLTEFQQVLDILNTKDFKELNTSSTPGIKEFAQRQIIGVNSLIAAHLSKGDINGNIKINFVPHVEFDGKIDAFSQLFINDFAVEGIIETL